MDIFNKCDSYEIAKVAKAANIYPYFHYLTTKQGPVVKMENRREIMIGSNNYLGLTSDKRVIKAGLKALKKYGTGCSGSRFLNGTLDLHIELEKKLAEFLHKDECISFGTGFQSNLGIISAIVGRNDYVICDKENHASIYDGCRLSFGKMLRYKHSDMADLEIVLESVPKDAGILIVTDGVFSMGGDVCKLPEIVKLAKKFGARIMVDDAHALGVIGDGGRGTASFFNLENEVDIIMGTFSKSLASIGGYMAANSVVTEFVKHNSRPFIFSASITPASAACALEALKVLISEPDRPKKLMEIANYARTIYKEYGLPTFDSFAPIIPLSTKTTERTFRICKRLFERGVYVNPVISPAVVEGECIIRTSYTATHTKEQILEAATIMKEVFDEFKV